MSSDHRFGSAFLDGSITADDVVIADTVRIATGAMPFVDLLGAACLVGLDG